LSPVFLIFHDISQGSEAARLTCDDIVSYYYCSVVQKNATYGTFTAICRGDRVIALKRQISLG